MSKQLEIYSKSYSLFDDRAGRSNIEHAKTPDFLAIPTALFDAYSANRAFRTRISSDHPFTQKVNFRSNDLRVTNQQMQPFYEKDGITIYHGDFREILPSLNLSVDAVLADPPYGETSLGWDVWPDGWPSFITRYLKNTGSMWCFGSFRMFIDHWQDFSYWKMSHEIIWEKHNGSGFMNDRFRRVHEFAFHFHLKSSPWDEVYKKPQFTMDARKRVVRRKDKPAQWTGARKADTYVSEDGGPRLMRSVIPARSCHGHAVNETQKPESLVRPLVSYCLPPGGILLSPFMGSGTDLVIAREFNCKAIGFDVREDQCQAAADRLAQGILF